MNAITKTLTKETLKEDKKSLSKLTKIIEKTPTKKELKLNVLNETRIEIDTLGLQFEAILFENSRLIEIKKQITELNKMKSQLVENIFKEALEQIKLLNEKLSNQAEYKHLEFNKKGLINILKNGLQTKLDKGLFSIYANTLDFIGYNLTINMKLATYNDMVVILNAYKLQLNDNKSYSKITKNAIKNIKNKTELNEFVKVIKEINRTEKEKLNYSKLNQKYGNNPVIINEKVA